MQVPASVSCYGAVPKSMRPRRLTNNFKDRRTVSSSSRKFLIVAGDSPLRTIVTRKMRLDLLRRNLKLNELEERHDRCPNCPGLQFVWDITKGDIICSGCGVVAYSALFSPPDPELFRRIPGRSSVVHDQREPTRSLTDPTYVRYFHFNEVLATLTLSGPWINNADYREIEDALREKGLAGPSRGDIQAICKSLNEKYGVQRFPKKYSEKWIQIRYRFSGDRPPLIHPSLINKLRQDFKIMVSHWSEAKRFLLGSKKTQKRVQWPNYLETIYHILKRRYPDDLAPLRPWITRLSPKKRKELKIFFNKLFELIGF